MNVFVSWSGTRSKILATRICHLIQQVVHPIKPWMSTSIDPGDTWFSEISQRLSENMTGIICITPENQENPWILFEAGALIKSTRKSNIIPYLFSLKKNMLKSPLSQFQALEFNKSETWTLILFLNQKLEPSLRNPENILQERFDAFWDKFEDSVISDTANITLERTEDFERIVESLSERGVTSQPLPSEVRFSEGFESYAFYESILSSVNKRLWILGRKNRKIFDKNFSRLLKEKFDNRNANAIDAKFLFLSPSSDTEILSSAHGDDDFLNQLQNSINKANEVRKLYPNMSFKYYSSKRSYQIVICDDVVIHTPIIYNSSGQAEPLTRCPFYVSPSAGENGAYILEHFLKVWSEAEASYSEN